MPEPTINRYVGGPFVVIRSARDGSGLTRGDWYMSEIAASRESQQAIESGDYGTVYVCKVLEWAERLEG